MVETNLKTKSDGRNMTIDLIKKIDVRVINKIIGYKINHSSRLNSVPTRFLSVTYLMKTKKEKVNMYEIMRHQLLDNIEKLKKPRSVVLRFESLLIHLFFQVIRKFPSIPDGEWNNNNQCTMNLVTYHYKR